MKNPNFPIFDTRNHYQFCKMSQKKQKSGVKIGYLNSCRVEHSP